MTDPERLQWHLGFYLSILRSPFRAGWRDEIWRRAKELAKEPALADLPRLLEAGLRELRQSTSTAGSTGAQEPSE